MPPTITKDRCNGCGVCVDVCGPDVYFGSATGEVPAVNYPEECWHCNSCVLECPTDAIRLRIPLPAMLVIRETPYPH